MKARSAKVKSFSETDAATLEASIQAWLDAAAEADIHEVLFSADGTNLHALIFYTE